MNIFVHDTNSKCGYSFYVLDKRANPYWRVNDRLMIRECLSRKLNYSCTCFSLFHASMDNRCSAEIEHLSFDPLLFKTTKSLKNRSILKLILSCYGARQCPNTHRKVISLWFYRNHKLFHFKFLYVPSNIRIRTGEMLYDESILINFWLHISEFFEDS